MADNVKIALDGKNFEFPAIVGTENEKAIDVMKLRDQTGYVTFDPGYGNTGATKSAITYIDGDKGILRYRGYPIEQLAEKSNFVEVAYLLIYGELPNIEQRKNFSTLLTRHSLIHEDMIHFFDNYPRAAHPMAILSAMVCSLSAYYPQSLDVNNKGQRDIDMIRLISKLRTIAAYSYKKSIGQPVIYPKNHYKYVENFLYMMFSIPAEEYELDPDFVKALDLLLILHADHEQNCSTSTVRMVGSSQANLYATIASGICALWGPLHGGANQAVIEMLDEINQQGLKPDEFLLRVKDKKTSTKLMGFGHRVYKSYDPRAKIIKEWCHKVVNKASGKDPYLETAMRLEEIALKDPYFVERKLYPNVDFYSGIIYRAMGLPTEMFTVMFALGRLPGWIAHWKEMVEEPGGTRISRPRQIYTGPTKRDFIPMEQRK